MAKANDTLTGQLNALNKHDPAAFVSYYSPNASVFDPAYPEPLRGQEAVRQDFSEFITAFPDLEMKLDRVVEDDGIVAYEIRMSGTHKGPLISPAGHIPATNRKIEVKGGVFSKFDSDGRITEEHRYYDLAGLLGQLGVIQ
jgi:steroid delta-isomerase-like uncharacterized protein